MKIKMSMLIFIITLSGAAPCWSQEQSGAMDIYEWSSVLPRDESRPGHLYDARGLRQLLDEHDYQSDLSLKNPRLSDDYNRSASASSSDPFVPQALNRPIYITASDGSADAVESQEEGKRWSSFLPFMSEEAKKRGYDLPLPFGAGINFLLMKRDIEVTDVEAGLNSEPVPVLIDLAIDTTSTVNNVTARFDAWILPFLDLYLLAGYTESESRVKVQFTIPGPGPAPDVPVDLDIEGDVDGPTVGGGLALAVGYQNFFLAGTANYTFTNLGGIFDEEVDAIVASIRTGWNGQVGNTKLTVWIGGTYWDTKREVTGSIPVGNSTVFFKVLQGPVNPVNLNFGTNVEITKKIHLTLDVGTNFDDMNSLIASFSYRF
jgi:hypothetical protein